jgi:hypothetical protein
MDDVGIVSCSIPFHRGTVSIDIHRKPISKELIDRERIGFLFFHKTKDIEHDSCIFHFKMLWGLLNAIVSFNTIRHGSISLSLYTNVVRSHCPHGIKGLCY